MTGEKADVTAGWGSRTVGIGPGKAVSPMADAGVGKEFLV